MKPSSPFEAKGRWFMAQIQPSTSFEYLLYTTVRLELGLAGNVSSIGTAFVYEHQTAPGDKTPMLITNRHVVAGSTYVTVRFHRRDPSAPTWAVDGYVDLAFPLSESEWIGHPDPTIDLCGIKLSRFQQHAQAQGKELAVLSLSQRLIPNDLAAFDAVEEIVMIGYPSGWWDETNNYPILRKGVTASHPGIDFNGKPEIAIDMACFPGSSGSPVLIPYSMARAKPVAFFDASRPVAFLGVLAAGPMFPIAGEVCDGSSAPLPTRTTIPMNLGFVVKAHAVAALASHIQAMI
jgi:hypothetical protein